MKERYCPKCKHKLTSKSHYFCDSCGVKLSDNIIHTPSNIKVKKYKTNKESIRLPKLSLNFDFEMDKKTYYLIASLVILFLAIWVFEFLEINDIVIEKIKKQRVTPVTTTENKHNTLSSDKSFLSESFNAEFPDLVPFESDVYFEINDIQNYITHFVTNIDESLLEKAPLLLNNNFAGFIHENTLTILMVPKDFDVAKAFVDTIENKDWVFKMVGNIVVMSQTSGQIENVVDTYEKKTLSLNQNPQFVTKNQNIPDKGKARILFMKSGSKFILKEFVKDRNEAIIEITSKILDTNFDEVVLN